METLWTIAAILVLGPLILSLLAVPVIFVISLLRPPLHETVEAQIVADWPECPHCGVRYARGTMHVC